MGKTITLKSAVSDLKLFPSRISENVRSQFKTMKSVQTVDDSIYLLDVKHDYALDDLLEEGIDSILGLLDFARRRMVYGANSIKLQPQEMGCSAFDAYNDKGEHIMGRNFDYKAAPVMVVRTAPANGYKSLAFADCNFMIYGNINKPLPTSNSLQTLIAPYVCVDGMNEKGLAIAVLELKTTPVRQRTGKTPICTTIAIRAVLDKCATVDEAIALFRQYDMVDLFGVAYHFIVSDATGKAVVLEYVHDELVVLPAEKKTEEGLPFIAVTNNYLCPYGPFAKKAGGDRLLTLNNALAEKGGRINEDEAMELLHSVHLEYYHQLGWKVITLWSAVYNSDTLDIDLVSNMHYDKVHTFNVLNDPAFD